MLAKEANRIAEKIDMKLSLDDERFGYSVKIMDIHEGSFQFYDNAFVMEIDDFLAIFTEHHKYFVYHIEDVSVSMYKRSDKFFEYIGDSDE